MDQTAWQIWRKKIFIFYQAKKNSFNILSLLCRIEAIIIFIILPSKNTPWIYWVFFAELKNKYFYYVHILPSIKKTTGSSLQNWKKWLYYSTRLKTLLKYPGSSEQNQDPECLKTEGEISTSMEPNISVPFC